jgi:hypothetical protein
MEVTGSSKKLVPIYHATQHHISYDHNITSAYCENLKSGMALPKPYVCLHVQGKRVKEFDSPTLKMEAVCSSQIEVMIYQTI